MAKNTKKQVSNHGKPITSFFTKKQPSSPAVPSSSQKTPLSQNSTTAQANSQAEKQALSNSNKSNSNVIRPKLASGSKETSQSGAVSPQRRSERKTHQSASSIASSLKRARTPELQAQTRKPVSAAGRVKTPERKKSKFDTDSESDPNAQEVVYVKSPNPQPSKKQRLSSPIMPEPGPSRFSTADIVPSSQSDEEELLTAPPPIRTSMVSKASTKRSTLPTPHPEDDRDSFAMAVDDPPVFRTPLTPPKIQSSSTSFSTPQMLTPPSSDQPDIPGTPIALDQATKTAQLIADIRARAFSKVHSSPEPDMEFKDELDSDDDDDLPLVPLSKPASGKDVDMRDDTAGPSTRRSSRLSERLRSHSPIASRPPLAPPARPKKSADPFAALFKEKRKAEKAGSGTADIERAEQVAASYGKGNLLDEMDEDEDEDDPLAWGPNIASLTIKGILHSDSTSLQKENSLGEIVLPSPKDRKGKTVFDILEQDKAERRNQGSADQESGIRLWLVMDYEDSQEAMPVDEDIQAPGKTAFVNLLNRSLQRADTERAVSLLNMSSVLSVEHTGRSSFASFLCDAALSSRSESLANAAERALKKFWASSTQPISSTITAAQVTSCIRRLGADPVILSTHGWKDDTQTAANARFRSSTLERLIGLVMACAQTRRLRQSEATEVALTFLLIGMDPRTSPSTSRDIVHAVDLTIRCLSPKDAPQKKSEFTLALRLLEWASLYHPVNKARLVSLLSNGSGPVRQIAEFVAYCIVADKPTPVLHLFTELPSLVDFLEQLSPYSKSTNPTPGKFAIHQTTNYVDLGFYVFILGVALSDIKAYVILERQTKAAQPVTSTPKLGPKPKTELELVHGALETLHSSILDSRAAHLDRSCTKAAVKQVSMNVHYQRQFWLQYTQTIHPKTLDKYFSKKT